MFSDEPTVEISSVVSSGTACGPAVCHVDAGGNCRLYTISLVQAGSCEVRIDRSDGTSYSETVSISHTTSSECGGEFRPDRDLIVRASRTDGAAGG